VNRDALFSHHSLSESFLQRIMSMYTAAHYKNSPNDLQLLSDAPAHELYVLLGPAAASGGAGRLPDVLCVVQVAFEGRISRQTLGDNMARGRSTAGDLIPWSLSMQFGDDGFATLCGARVVRIATHPDVQKMGYGSRAMQLLLKHFRGNMLDLDASDASDDDDEDTDDDEEEDKDEIDEDEDEEDDDSAVAAAEDDGEGRESGSRSKSSKKKLLREELRPRSKLPPLLVPLASRRPPMLHWCGVSFGVTTPLLNYWLRLGFELTYLRQTKNEVTGEHTAILLCDLTSSSSSSSSDGMLVDRARDDGPRPVDGWLEAFVWDARRRLVSLLAFTFRDFPTAMSLSLLSSGGSVSVDAKALTAADLGMFVTPHDLKRLDMYARNMVDYHLITDILPTLARLYFLGHLSNGSGGEGDLSLSMVQKAIFLGTGLHIRRAQLARQPGACALQQSRAESQRPPEGPRRKRCGVDHRGFREEEGKHEPNRAHGGGHGCHRFDAGRGSRGGRRAGPHEAAAQVAGERRWQCARVRGFGGGRRSARAGRRPDGVFGAGHRRRLGGGTPQQRGWERFVRGRQNEAQGVLKPERWHGRGPCAPRGAGGAQRRAQPGQKEEARSHPRGWLQRSRRQGRWRKEEKEEQQEQEQEVVARVKQENLGFVFFGLIQIQIQCRCPLYSNKPAW
jgi:hypothetical protein